MQAVRRQRKACAKASEGQAPRDLRGRGQENEDAADHGQVLCRIIIIIIIMTRTEQTHLYGASRSLGARMMTCISRTAKPRPPLL